MESLQQQPFIESYQPVDLKITSETIHTDDKTARMIAETSFFLNSEMQKRYIERFNLKIKIQKKMDEFFI